MDVRVTTEQSQQPVYDRIREKLQMILDAMDNYMHQHPDKVRSEKSARLISIQKIAQSIYDYYRKDNQLTDFNKNLSDLLKQKDNAAEANKITDANQRVLLPKLQPDYFAPPLLHSVWRYHNILRLIQQEIENMSSWRGRSLLRDGLITAISGGEELAEELGTNLYMVIYSNNFAYTTMIKNPADYACYVYEALSSSRIYESDQNAVTFNCDGQSHNVIFKESREKAVAEIYNSGYTNTFCIGAEFSLSLQKEQYVPLLSSVHQMDFLQITKQAKEPNSKYKLEPHPTRAEFTIVRNAASSLKKVS